MTKTNSDSVDSRWRLPRGLLVLVLMLLAFAVLTVAMPQFKPLFSAWFPTLPQPMYDRESFVALTWAHIQLVIASSLMAVLIGVGLGIAVTRKAGHEFEPLVSACSAIGQTFPPAAVLAIAVPMVGLGFLPALVALTLYGLLPIIENTIRGLKAIPPAVLTSADGMGMSTVQRLYQIELPLALPMILAGIRISVMINIGTATIGSTVGAKSLGTPIIAGLVNHNVAYVIQGAVLVALLAVITDKGFEVLIRAGRSGALR